MGTSILIQHCCKDPFSIVIMLHTGCCTNNVKCHKLDDSQHMPAPTTKNCKMKHTATPFPQVHIAPAQKHAVREISCGYQYAHTALLQGSVLDSHHAAHRLLYKQCQMPQTGRQPAHAFTNNRKLQDETHGHTLPASTYCPSPGTYPSSQACGQRNLMWVPVSSYSIAARIRFR